MTYYSCCEHCETFCATADGHTVPCEQPGGCEEGSEVVD
jgi:hypothetical protein